MIARGVRATLKPIKKPRNAISTVLNSKSKESLSSATSAPKPAQTNPDKRNQ